jgi:hypothetical protein
MTTSYKVLGQSAPAATSNVDVYAVPASTQAVISTIVVANRATTTGSFRIAVRPNGAGLANQHYIAFDVPILGNDSTTLTLGITAAAGTIITARASSASMSFNVFGTEIV